MTLRSPRLGAAHNATGSCRAGAECKSAGFDYCRDALRRGRTARSCTGINGVRRESPCREDPRHNREGDDVNFCLGRWGAKCMSRPGKTEYAVGAGLLFWRAARRRRIASGCGTEVMTDFKTCPVRTPGGKAPCCNRQRQALQHEGNDQDRGGKLAASRSPQSS